MELMNGRPQVLWKAGDLEMMHDPDVFGQSHVKSRAQSSEQAPPSGVLFTARHDFISYHGLTSCQTKHLASGSTSKVCETNDYLIYQSGPETLVMHQVEEAMLSLVQSIRHPFSFERRDSQ